MTNELERHEKYRELSTFVYNYDENNVPKGTKLLYKSENAETGFFACAFEYDGRIVVVFRGTNIKEKTDRNNDFAMLFDKIPAQTRDALRFIDQLEEIKKKRYPKHKIVLTGHSLGGSLAQICHIRRFVYETVTFNAYGTADLNEEYLSKYEMKSALLSITNYICKLDPISGMGSKDKHIGKCYSLTIKENNRKTFGFLFPHFLENLKPLNTRTDVSNEYEAPIPKERMSFIDECIGTYKVRGYVKSDGTKVRSYIRSCGAKHNKSNEGFYRLINEINLINR